MTVDLFNLIFSIIIFAIFGTMFILSAFYTFFLETFRKIDEILKVDLIPACILTPLEENISWVDAWLMSNNKIVGPILLLLCAIDIKFSLEIIFML